MIPTRYKSKLPRHLSHPIGAEALTEGLAGAPHAESFTVSFRDKPVRPGRPSRGAPAETPYQILDAQFCPARQAGYTGSALQMERGVYDESWELTVYPIARELRHAALISLREQGLPLVARWLGGSGRAGWTFRCQRIELMFDPASGVISAKEVTGS